MQPSSKALAAAVFLIPAVAIAATLLLATIPGQDYPEHLHMVSTILRGSSAAVDYSVSLAPRTYVGLYWIWTALALPTTPEIAGGIVLALYALGTVLATVFVLRRVRPEIPLAGAVAVGWWFPFSFFYYMGFVPYLLSVPLVLLLAAHLFDLMRGSGEGRVRTATWISLVLVALYLAHPQAAVLGAAVLASGILLLRRSPEGGRTPFFHWAGLVVFAVLLAALALYQTTEVLPDLRASAAGGSLFGNAPWLDTLGLAVRVPLGPVHGTARLLQWAALALLAGAVLSSWKEGPEGEPDARAHAFGSWLLAIAIVMALGSYAMAATQSTGTVFHRLFIFPYIFLVVAWASKANWRRAAILLACLSALVHIAAVVTTHAGFTREASGALALLERVPSEATVLPVFFDRDAATVSDEYVHAMQHVAAYHPARRGRAYLYSPDHQPLPVRPRFSRDGLPPLPMPWRFQWDARTRAVPYMLVRAPNEATMQVPAMSRAFSRVVRTLDEERAVLARDDVWILWGPEEAGDRAASAEDIIEDLTPDTAAAAAPAGNGMGFHGMPPAGAHPPLTGGGSHPAVEGSPQGPVPRAEGPDARTVAGVHAQREDLAGRQVVVRGRVTKVSRKIMGRNWIHLQDGTGSEEAGDHDLVVTTKGDAAVGEVVVVRGTVAVDRDLGFGYHYAVLVEEAEVER